MVGHDIFGHIPSKVQLAFKKKKTWANFLINYAVRPFRMVAYYSILLENSVCFHHRQEGDQDLEGKEQS